MRTLSGIICRSSEIAVLEQISTSVAATPIPMALDAAVVTASVGQVPSTSRSTGFSSITPRFIASRKVSVSEPPPAGLAAAAQAGCPAVSPAEPDPGSSNSAAISLTSCVRSLSR